MNTAVSSPVAALVTELAALNAKSVELNNKLVAERNAALRELPAQFGYQNAEEFMDGFRMAQLPAANGSNGTKASRKASRKANGNGKRFRASITPEKRKEFIAILKKHNNEKTAIEWAQQFGCSVATVQNLREEAGVTDSR